MRITARKAAAAKAVNSSSASHAPVSFSELLGERLKALDEDLKELEEQRQELRTLQRDQKITEVIRRIMPDGSIMITEYAEGKIESRTRTSPYINWGSCYLL